MSLETSFSLLSLDPAGYPTAIALNALHLLTRISVFTSALPAWLKSNPTASIWRARKVTDAEARLAALKRASKATSSGWGWKLATLLSIILIIISVVNAAYLFTRRRKYHLMLRQDPLSSPNAHATKIDFSPPRPKLSMSDQLKKKAKALLWKSEPENFRSFPIQELDIWTPDYVKWSLHIFQLYSPPTALVYHFLTPSNFFPLAICGGILTFQTTLLVRFYSTLVSDRALLQSEVMHEYNAKFVNPRIFVQKRDMATDTDELELLQVRSIRRKTGIPRDGGDEEQQRLRQCYREVEAANVRFQQVGLAYSVLKDDKRRERYDTTGETDEGSGVRTEAEWKDYWKELWSGEVNADSIAEFTKKYQGSDEEKTDLFDAYTKSSGDIEEILSNVMCSTIDDEDRFVSLINDGIAAGELKSTPAWKKALKDTKAKAKRRAEANAEASEAEAYAKELGVHDKLFGENGKGGKGKKGKGKAADEDPEAALRALIQGNQAKRMDSLFDSLEAKYGAKENKKGKKRGGDVEDGGKKKKQKEVEPTDEEFAKIQAEMDARRAAKSGDGGGAKKAGRKNKA
ncbi:hypothetical protein MNV49_003308 [Pseudohyphozyma bogoriensis]|nr:hypothetical protein MNV49_003308 [Pseudohyphozyma bogoriensis]